MAYPPFAVTYLFRTTGQVLGVSLSGTVLQAVLQKKLQERITGPGAAQVSFASHHAQASRLTFVPQIIESIR